MGVGRHHNSLYTGKTELFPTLNQLVQGSSPWRVTTARLRLARENSGTVLHTFNEPLDDVEWFMSRLFFDSRGKLDERASSESPFWKRAALPGKLFAGKVI